MLSRVQLFGTPWTVACQASQSFLKLVSIKSMMPSNHLILGHPLLLLPSIFPSIRVFSNESILHIRWPKYWSFFSISPSNEYSGLISFRIDWLDLLAATLNSIRIKGLSIRILINSLSITLPLSGRIFSALRHKAPKLFKAPQNTHPVASIQRHSTRGTCLSSHQSSLCCFSVTLVVSDSFRPHGL